MTRRETTPRPQPHHDTQRRGDTLTPAPTSRSAPVQGTSREDMRRDTQRPAATREGATNVLRFSA